MLMLLMMGIEVLLVMIVEGRLLETKLLLVMLLMGVEVLRTSIRVWQQTDIVYLTGNMRVSRLVCLLDEGGGRARIPGQRTQHVAPRNMAYTRVCYGHQSRSSLADSYNSFKRSNYFDHQVIARRVNTFLVHSFI